MRSVEDRSKKKENLKLGGGLLSGSPPFMENTDLAIASPATLYVGDVETGLNTFRR